MPNIAKVLKDEIARIARREANSTVAPVGTSARGLKHTAADLRRKVALLERQVRALEKKVAGLGGARPPSGGEEAKARITAKGVRSLRRRLRLSGQEFAKLLGITPQVVYGWEKASGPLKVRQKTRAAILEVRGIGAREAKRRLDAAGTARKPRTAPAGKGKKARTRR